MTFASAGSAPGTWGAPPACPRCGRPWGPSDLACPACGTLKFRDRLEQLAAEAQRWEPVDPVRAAMLWRQCLDLLPAGSGQHELIQARMNVLAAGMQPAPAGAAPPSAGDAPP